MGIGYVKTKIFEAVVNYNSISIFISINCFFQREDHGGSG